MVVPRFTTRVIGCNDTPKSVLRYRECDIENPYCDTPGIFISVYYCPMFSTCTIIEFKGHEIGIYRALTPLFGNGAGALGIGKISRVSTKIGKIYIVYMYEVSIARLIQIVNLKVLSIYIFILHHTVSYSRTNLVSGPKKCLVSRNVSEKKWVGR